MTTDTPGSSDAARLITDPGCQQMVGYRTEVFAGEGRAVVSLDMDPRHCNRHGILHGGMAATLLDVACGQAAAGCFDPSDPPPVVTVSLNLSYVASAQSGTLIAEGSVVGGGRSILHARGELRDDTGRILASATGVFRRLGRR